MEKTATRSSWKNFPIDQPKRIEIDLQFLPEQYEKMKHGLIPEEMEDKWFIFFEDDILYFHRSWSGLGIYSTKLEKDREGYCIREFFVERNPEKYSEPDDDADRHKISLLILWGLLGIDVRQVYSEAMIRSKQDAARAWSDFGRMFFSEDLF